MIGAEDISAAWENQYQSGIWFIIKQKEFEIRFKIAVNGGIFLPQRQSVICLTHYKSSCSIVFNPSILFFRINFAPLFEVILNKTDNLLEFLFAVAGHFDWFAEGWNGTTGAEVLGLVMYAALIGYFIWDSKRAKVGE